MTDCTLSATRLRQLFSYDTTTGFFTRLVRTAKNSHVGQIAGSVSGNGYVYLNVDGKRYCAHRLVFLYINGELPREDVDHINGVRKDNRLQNLRCVPRYVNNQNRRSVRKDNRSSGLMGVSARKGISKPWRARITTQGLETSLGSFETKDQAYQVYLKAKRRMHEGCTI